MNKKLIHTVVEAAALKFPQKEAIVTSKGSITYQHLNALINGIADDLCALSIERGDTVCVLLDPGVSLAATMLGVFKSGGVYLPTASTFTKARWRTICEVLKPQVFITTARQLEWFEHEIAQDFDVPFAHILLLNENGLPVKYYRYTTGIKEEIELEAEPIATKADVQGSDGAYIYFTSGTTGNGKAFLGQHKSLGHFLHWQKTEFEATQEVRVSQISKVTFDASLRDYLLPLSVGGTLYIPDDSVRNNPLSLLDWLAENEISWVHTVPSVFRLLIREMEHREKSELPNMGQLKWIFLAGEALYGRDILSANQYIGDQVSMINLYGTSETTMAKTFYTTTSLPRNEGWKVPVGKPISNTAIAVINQGRACMVGEIGEVYIKTPFMTKGYIDQPTRNASVFVQNPLESIKKDIIYKTGDLGRLNVQGDLEVLGRLDDQIKLNGLRVNLVDIEGEVLELEGVEEVVLTHETDIDNGDSLICYYTGDAAIQDSMASQLRTRLEEAYIPHIFVHLDQLPQGVNGKVDKRMLPKPEELMLRHIHYSAPVGEMESTVARLFEEVLAHPRIGRDMKFFKMGGTSLKAMRLIARCLRELKVEVELKEVYENETPETLAKIISHKEKVGDQTITAGEEAENHPLSYGQQRLWVTCQLEQEHSAYNMVEASLLRMDLDIMTFDLAFQKLVGRHEALRTVFEARDGEVFQRIIPEAQFDYSIDHQDFSLFENPRAKVDVAIEQETIKKFDLEDGPLFRISLFKLSENNYVYVFVVHHIICDGWSLEVLLKDFLDFYQEEQGSGTSVSAPTLQYRDYARWQQNQQETARWKQMENYWLEQLGRDIPLIDLPVSYPRSKKKTSRGSKAQLMISTETVNNIQRKIEDNNTSLFVFLLSTVKCLLYRYTRQETIVVGSPVAGRTRQELEGQVGFYANTLAFLSEINSEESFNTLLQQVNQTVVEGMQYQDYPFDLIIDQLQVDRTTGRSPLFDVMVVLQDTHQIQDINGSQLTDLEVSSYPIEKHATKFDLTFTFGFDGDQIVLNLEYSTELFAPEMINRTLGHFERMLKTVAADDTTTVSAINYLDEGEKQQLISAYKGPEVDLPLDKLWHQLFEKQVLKYPNKIAVKCGETTLTYHELNEKANQLAHHLRNEADVSTGDYVVFLAERDHWMIICLLAIWKADAVYVPVDPNYPAERVAYILDDTNARVILTETQRNSLPESPDIQCINYKDDWSSIANGASENLSVHQTNKDLSYVIYTSGSTGKPKGVMVEHQGMMNHLFAKVNDLQIDDQSILIQNASQSFDISIWQAIAALMCGGTTVVYDNATVMDPELFISNVEEDQVTILEVVPSYLDNLMEIMKIQEVKKIWSRLDYLMVTGEAVQSSVLRQWFDIFPHTPVVNAYGPTEASDDITHHFMYEAPKVVDIPVGKTVQNLNIYILDQNLQLCPKGVKGEICVSGIGVGRGYVNRDELTQQVFMADPFEKGKKMYRTGDLGRFLPDGTLEFYGRLDNQVKVRGYRIELGEVENKLTGIKNIRQVAVLLQQDDQKQSFLAAFITVNQENMMSAEHIKTEALKLLPNYMVPESIRILEKMPVTPNGKIDRKKLAGMGIEQPVDRVMVLPTNETEVKLLSIWKNLIGDKELSITDNFFEVGGHSLRATRMVSFIYKEFKVKLDLRFIFDHPTIAQIARKIVSSDQVVFHEIKPLEAKPLYDASHAQLRFWLIDQREKVNNHYNVSTSHVMEGDFKVDIFQDAFNRVIERHDVLRSRFTFDDDRLKQKVEPTENTGFFIELEDFREKENREEAAIANLDELSQTTFNLSKLPLIRARVIQVDDERYFFLLVMPHIITDGWSMQILLREVLTFYNAIKRGLPAPFSPLTIQYRDYAHWHNEQLAGENLINLEDYWMKRLAQLPVLDLPVDYPRVDRTRYTGRSIAFHLDTNKAQQLQDLSYAYESSLYMTYMSFFYGLLHLYTHQEDLIVGTPIAGRTHPDLENLIGCFINIMPVRLQFSSTMTFRELVHQLKREFLNDSERQMYPLEKMIQKLNSKDFAKRNQLFDVVFIFQNTQLNMEEVEELDQVKVSTLHLENIISRLDLEVVVTEVEGEGITTVFNYNVDLLSNERVQLMTEKFQQIMDIVLDNPDIALNELNVALEEQLSTDTDEADLELSLEMNF